MTKRKTIQNQDTGHADTLPTGKLIPKPYQEKEDIRIFSCEIDSSDLIWHFDNEDRLITVIEGDWSLQYDNKLPIVMEPGYSYYIPKEEWHRIIKGSKDLIIKVKNVTKKRKDKDS